MATLDTVMILLLIAVNCYGAKLIYDFIFSHVINYRLTKHGEATKGKVTCVDEAPENAHVQLSYQAKNGNDKDELYNVKLTYAANAEFYAKLKEIGTGVDLDIIYLTNKIYVFVFASEVEVMPYWKLVVGIILFGCYALTVLFGNIVNWILFIYGLDIVCIIISIAMAFTWKGRQLAKVPQTSKVGQDVETGTQQDGKTEAIR